VNTRVVTDSTFSKYSCRQRRATAASSAKPPTAVLANVTTLCAERAVLEIDQSECPASFF